MVYWTIAPTATPTLLPQTTYSYMMNNITSNGFNLAMLPQTVLLPYGFATLGLAIPVFLLMFGYFINMWFTNGNLKIASLTGLLLAGLFFIGGGIGIALPAPVYPIIYGCLAASITGYLLSTFKRV